MNKQEIFDAVVRHAYAQRERSRDEDETCLYRGPGGTKCFIGALIPDDKYDPDMECKGLGEVAIMAGLNFAEFGELMSSLQVAHDSHDVNDWPQALAKVAMMHNLNTEVLDRLQRECPL